MTKGVVIGAGTAAALLLSVPFIANWEGKRNDPYRDIVGISTVCYGETRVEMRRYSDAECLAMLRESVSEFQDDVLKCTPVLKDHPHKLAAATSLAYNIGSTGYCRSTAARRFNAGRFREGCEAFKMWVKAGGVTVKGLVRRRNEEVKLCLTSTPT